MHILIMSIDPLISQHTIEYLVCKETYNSPRAQKIQEWSLFGGGVDWCVYRKGSQSIIGFRGTKSPNDILNDVQLSLGHEFQKVQPFTKLVKEFITDVGDEIMLTGHSLGGALAREVAKNLKLHCVTFNCAAPPIAPAPMYENQTHYHIVFDLISAWQANAIRIDKNIRPNQSSLNYYARKLPLVGRFVGRLFRSYSLKQMMEAHKLDTFSSEKPGKLISNDVENFLWKDWFDNLPGKVRVYFRVFTSVRELPPVV
jgi:hypothetical protein